MPVGRAATMPFDDPAVGRGVVIDPITNAILHDPEGRIEVQFPLALARHVP